MYQNGQTHFKTLAANAKSKFKPFQANVLFLYITKPGGSAFRE